MAQYIYGRNVVVSRLKEAKDIDEIYLLDSFKDRTIMELVKNSKVKTIWCKKGKLDSLAGNEFHQGIVAKVHTYDYYDFNVLMDDLREKEDALIVMLDGIEDPHNFGAIIRTCECAGVHGIIIPNRRACQVNETVIKTSAGATANMKIATVNNLNNAIANLKDKGIWVYGLELGGQDIYKTNLTGAIALVVGSEGFGISRLVKENCDEVVTLPRHGKINSLNASVACGVAVYEIAKQR